jgi:hypothetical protein
MKRVQWEVRYDKGAGCWSIFRAGEWVDGWTKKCTAVRAAADTCRMLYGAEGELSELTIKKKNGQIQDKRTYGKDLRGTRG